VRIKKIHAVMFSFTLPMAGGVLLGQDADRFQEQVDLVSPNQPAAIDSPGFWEYRKMAGADLDGDGIQERIVILANIGIQNGQEGWNDGQQWEVRIEELDGTQTRVYAQYVQLGRVEGYIVGSRKYPSLFLVELTGAGIRGFDIDYRGPGNVSARQAFSRTVERAVLDDYRNRK
jgi:hypothetical protein